MRRSIRCFAILAAIVAAFAYGVSVAKYKLFPYSLLASVKHSASGHKHGPLWHTRVSIFAASPAAPTVMLGDSITELALFHAGVTNHGISGDTTAKILDRLQVTIDAQPERVFVLVGGNDFADNHSVKSVFANYREIIDRLRSAGIAVHVQSTLQPSAASLRHVHDAIFELNKLLSDHCRDTDCVFIDLNSVLCPQGTLDDRYSLDGIHLNGEGCRVWLKTIGLSQS